jgi:hypothetical protein
MLGELIRTAKGESYNDPHRILQATTTSIQ